MLTFKTLVFCSLMAVLTLHHSKAIRVKTDVTELGEAQATKPRKGYYRRSGYDRDWRSWSGYEGTNMGIGGIRYYGAGDVSEYARESGFGLGGGSGGYGYRPKGDGGYPHASDGYDGGSFGYKNQNPGYGGGQYQPNTPESYFPSGVYPPPGGTQPGGGGVGSYGSDKGYQAPPRPARKPRPPYKGAPNPGYNKGFGRDGFSGSENTGFEITLSIGRPNSYKNSYKGGSTYGGGW